MIVSLFKLKSQVSENKKNFVFKDFCTVYELEPQKVTGIVRYVGRIDSEFVDTRMYVGVKLDEPCKCQWHHLSSHDQHFFTT